MNYSTQIQIPLNINGRDLLADPLSIDFQNRVISLTGEITDEFATVVNASLRHLARVNDDDIIIYINSPGGSVTAGFSIYDTIKAMNCDVCTVATGMAASMGAFLLTAAGTKGKRYAKDNAEVMLHQPLGSVSGQASDIRIHAENILRIKDKLNRILSEASGQGLEVIERDTDRDNFMDAQEALNYGLIDKIGDPFFE